MVTATDHDVSVPRVLLVDDRPENLLALEAVLEPLALELVSVRSGEEALRQLLAGDFAVIVLDVQMPVLDGFETARLIKRRERTRHVPIIFLTAISGEREHFLRGYETGAVDYVYKPFEPAILAAKVSVFADLWRRGVLIERQRAELAARLADLDQAHRDLARQALELERSNAALERVAQVAAHDLRDPLFTVAGLVDLLRDRHPAEGEAADLAERAAAAVGRMQERVAAVLAYARASTDDLDRELVPLDEAIGDACGHLRDDLQAAGAVVLADDLPSVRADRRQLVRLFAALLDNAVRFRAEHGLRVEVGAARLGGGWEVTVSDNGRGVDPAELPRLLTVFARTRPDGSAPTGLALCRRIVERHGGTIGVEPRPGGGTTVRFSLPDVEA